MQEEQRDYQELESLLESTQEKLDKVEEKAAKKIAKKIEDNYHLPDGTSIELINSLLPDMDFQDVFMELALERHEILSNAQFQIEEHTWSSRFGAAASGVWDTLVYFKDDIYNNPGDYAVEIASVLPFGIAVAAGDTGYEVYQGRKTLTQAGVEIGVSAVLNVFGLKLVQKTGKALKNIGKVGYKNIASKLAQSRGWKNIPDGTIPGKIPNITQKKINIIFGQGTKKSPGIERTWIKHGNNPSRTNRPLSKLIYISSIL